jgi:hypothetical protein
MIAERLAAARAEIQARSMAQINAEAAAVWGARAVAAYERFRTSHDNRWLVMAIEFRHEACEHGGEAGTEFLKQLHTELDQLMPP